MVYIYIYIMLVMLFTQVQSLWNMVMSDARNFLQKIIHQAEVRSLNKPDSQQLPRINQSWTKLENPERPTIQDPPSEATHFWDVWVLKTTSQTACLGIEHQNCWFGYKDSRRDMFMLHLKLALSVAPSSRPGLLTFPSWSHHKLQDKQLLSEYHHLHSFAETHTLYSYTNHV